jgi:aminoglycoside 3-N-acetyltransferase
MNFTGENFFKSLKKIGIKNKDNLFIHSDVGLLKEYKNKKELNQTCKIIIKQLQKVVGKEGTIVFPTFTYSFPNKKRYYPKISKSICGYLSEYAKKMKSSQSYNDPNVSVVVIGKKKKLLTKEPTENAYGKNSFFQRFYNLGGQICNINMDAASTFIHLFERTLNVKYRIDKIFYGYEGNKKKRRKNSIFVIKKKFLYTTDFKNFNLFASKYYNVSNIGRGFVGRISLKKTFQIVENGLKKNKNFLIKRKRI